MVERPVTQTAEVDVNKASTQDISCPDLTEKGNLNSNMPATMIPMKLRTITNNGDMRLFFICEITSLV